MRNEKYWQYYKTKKIVPFFHRASLCQVKIYRPFGILTVQLARVTVRLMNYLNMFAVTKYNLSLTLRSLLLLGIGTAQASPLTADASGNEPVSSRQLPCDQHTVRDISTWAAPVAGALLRRDYRLQEQAVSIKYSQWQQALKALTEQERRLSLLTMLYLYYERLLGVPASNILIPELGPLDTHSLDEMNYRQREPSIALRAIPLETGPLQHYALQSNIAATDINQLFVKLRALQIAVHSAMRDWEAAKHELKQSAKLVELTQCAYSLLPQHEQK